MGDTKKFSLESPLEDSAEHIMLLGTIAARWATLDHVLVSALASFIGNAKAANAIYFASSSQQLRLDMLRVTVPVSPLPVEFQAECSKLLDAIGELWLRRNLIMHNAATISEDKPGEYMALVRRPLRKKANQLLPLLTKEMQEHIDALSEAACLLMVYSNESIQRQLIGLLGEEPS